MLTDSTPEYILSLEATALEQIGGSAIDQPSIAEKVRGFYELSKPGITQMVVLTAAAGYYLSVGDNVYFRSIPNLLHCVLALFGTACISSGACAWNQYLEREADAKMKRTMNRPIPSGLIQPDAALIFAIVCSVVGAVSLYFVNTLTFVLALATHLSYTVLYTPLKKKSWTAMLLGGIPGALPALGGWTAGSNAIGTGAVVLFAIMFIWQMPHFLALSIMYRSDYGRGGFALLGNDESATRKVALHALAYTIALVPIGALLYFAGIAGSLYLIGFLALAGLFIYKAVGVVRSSSTANARALLMASYAFLMGVFLFMFVDKI